MPIKNAAAQGVAQTLSLSWPVACELGRTCFVQNFFDHDSTEAVRDFACGSRTYNGHDGTDIRLIDTRAEREGAEVMAAASGRVLRVRDGVADISIRLTGKAAVAGRECGNGLVIDHGQGWSTQYCHLQQGSIRVAPGEAVTAGTPLGKVGLSGETEVPHLHLTVRHNDIAVDPFGEGKPDLCAKGRSLWSEQVSRVFRYADREIMIAGFAGTPVTMEVVESGALRGQEPDRRSAVLAAYVRAIGLKKGDEQVLSVRFPDGSPLAEFRGQPLANDKAEFFVTAGRRQGPSDWPSGTYAAEFRVSNNGADVLSKTFQLSLRP